MKHIGLLMLARISRKNIARRIKKKVVVGLDQSTAQCEITQSGYVGASGFQHRSTLFLVRVLKMAAMLGLWHHGARQTYIHKIKGVLAYCMQSNLILLVLLERDSLRFSIVRGRFSFLFCENQGAIHHAY